MSIEDVDRAKPSLRNRVAPASESRGNPEVHILPSEARRHDPNQRTRLAIKDERLIQDLRIAIEPGGPQFVAHHKYWRRAGRSVPRRDAASEERGNAQKLEGIGGDEASIESLRAFAAGINNILFVGAGDAIENMVLLLIIEKLRRREASTAVIARLRRVANLKRNQPLGVAVRKRIEQNVLDHAENGRGRADAEREREDGEKRKGTILAKAPKTESRVAPERIHQSAFSDAVHQERLRVSMPGVAAPQTSR